MKSIIGREVTFKNSSDIEGKVTQKINELIMKQLTMIIYSAWS